MVSGQAAADVVHLLAELIENATLFSPRDTQVPRHRPGTAHRRGAASRSRDDGVGISPVRLAEMNWRLDHPPVVDVSISGTWGCSRYPGWRPARDQGPAPPGRRRRACPPWSGCPAASPGRESRRYSRPAVAAAREGVVHRAGARRPTARGPGRRRPAAARTGHAAQLDMDGELPDGAMQTAAAASGRSDWFRAKRPSGGAEQLPPPRAASRPRSRYPRGTATTPATWLAARRVQAHGTRPASRPTRPARRAGRCPPADSWDDGGWRVAETVPPPSTGGQTTGRAAARACRREHVPAARRPAGRRPASCRRPGDRAPRRPAPGPARRGGGRRRRRAAACADSSSAAVTPAGQHA